MKTPAELDHYLNRLDQALGQTSVSERAEIVTEIKSHVMEAMSNEPDANLDSILTSLGEPEQVANKYLIERGMKPMLPPRHPVVKWLVIGFLGTMAMSLLAIGIVFWKFTPIVNVDEKAGRVQILGGLIDVNDEAGSFAFGFGSNVQFEGNQSINKNLVKNLDIDFTNGKLEIEASESGVLYWACKVKSNGAQFQTQTIGDTLKFDLSKYGGAKCEIEIPKGLKVAVKGANGKIDIEKPHFPIAVKMGNGKVDFEPRKGVPYRFDNHVVNGKVDSFESSQDEGALEVKIEVLNGKISRSS